MSKEKKKKSESNLQLRSSIKRKLSQWRGQDIDSVPDQKLDDIWELVKSWPDKDMRARYGKTSAG